LFDKNFDGAERIDGFPSYSRGYAMLSNIAGQQDGFASRFDNEAFRPPLERMRVQPHASWNTHLR
jgi:hypothetical protein